MQPELAASPETDSQRGRLLRVLGVGFGLAVIIGNTIGAGILRTPGDVATQMPNAMWFIGVWLAGGLYALLGAISLAELGAMIPRAGGQYVFAREALGEYTGFVVGWSDWLSTCGSAAAVSIVIGEYMGVLFPSLAGQTTAIASFAVIGFAVLQWRGVRWGSNIQNLTSLLKTLAFLALVAACFALGGKNSTATTAAQVAVAHPATTNVSFLFALVLALQSVIYTYDGWNGVLYFSEEVREPGRDIPRSMFGGVLLIITIYLLVNLALLYVLPMTQIAGSNLAVGAAAQMIFGAHGDTIIRSLTILSLLSGVNAFHLMASRTLYAMSRDDLFSQRAVKVNDGGTPTIALLITTIVGVLFILSGTFEKVVAVLAFFFVANYAVSFVSVFVLRRREPERPRPYRALGYPYTTALALIGSIAFLVGAVASDTRNSIRALLLLAASYPAFRALKWFARK